MWFVLGEISLSTCMRGLDFTLILLEELLDGSFAGHFEGLEIHEKGMGGPYNANRSNHASLPANKILIGVYNLGIYIYINIMTLVLDMFTRMIQELNELLK